MEKLIRAEQLNDVDGEVGSAQSHVGLCYLQGAEGVRMDKGEAVKWFTRAGTAGHAGAQFQLGDIYAAGLGVVKSWKTAVSWLEKSALQHNANAQFRLAECLSTGVVGVKMDVRRALNLYRLAAAQQQSDGSAQDLNSTSPKGYAFVCCAQNALGDCHSHGTHGVARDYPLAVEYYRKAAEHGCTGGLWNCGDVYLTGTRGCRKDFPLGIKYMKAAAACGSPGATVWVDRLREERACMACGKPRALTKCGRCNEDRYCDARCQLVAWRHPTASHKLQCPAHSTRNNHQSTSSSA